VNEPRVSAARPANPNWLTRGVLGIGLASLFSDWGHEAATSLLPAFLASLGAPAYALGLIEGVADGCSSFAKLAGGWIADRPHLRKPVAVIGYFATGLSTFAYAFAQSWPVLFVLRAVGWMGRGSRGPSRDALLADAVEPSKIGRAFGFERAMDTIGAVLGPLCATLLVASWGMRGVLRATVVPGVLAAIVFALLVPAVGKVHGRLTSSFVSSLRQMPSRYWKYLSGVFAHGLGDFAPTLLILRATQILAPRYGGTHAAAVAIGLYTFHNLVDALAAYPAGVLGDKLSKRVLLALGYALGAVVAAGFIFTPPSIPGLAILFGIAGIHLAVQQALEKALATEILPAESRGSGFGVLAAVNGIGDLVSSVAVGALWSALSPAAGFIYAGVLVLAGAVLILRAV
jgi:MFS family permease